MLIKKDIATQPLVFLMIDSSDHMTGKTGLSPTVTLSKNGASFASPSGSISEIGYGWYQVAGHASDTNTLGTLVLHATASGADPVDDRYEIIACDLQDATSLGLSRIDAAISSRSTYAGTDSTGVTTLLTRLPDTLSLAAVNAQLDTALADYDAPTQSEMAAAFTQIKGAGWDSETDTLEEIAAGSGSGGGGSGPSAADIADAVWDEALADHATAGSAGAGVANASSAGDPLVNAVPGSYIAGSAGDALARIFDVKTIVQAGEEQ